MPLCLTDRLLNRDIAVRLCKSWSVSRIFGCTGTTARLRDGTFFLFHCKFQVFYSFISALTQKLKNVTFAQVKLTEMCEIKTKHIIQQSNNMTWEINVHLATMQTKPNVPPKIRDNF